VALSSLVNALRRRSGFVMTFALTIRPQTSINSTDKSS